MLKKKVSFYMLYMLYMLSQVCAVHTLQALVKGSSLGVAVLQYTPVVAILSLTLLSSPCWAMRNAALQLYSTSQSHSLLFLFQSLRQVVTCRSLTSSSLLTCHRFSLHQNVRSTASRWRGLHSFRHVFSFLL